MLNSFAVIAGLVLAVSILSSHGAFAADNKALEELNKASGKNGLNADGKGSPGNTCKGDCGPDAVIIEFSDASDTPEERVKKASAQSKKEERERAKKFKKKIELPPPLSTEELQQRTGAKAIEWLNGEKKRAQEELQALKAFKAGLEKALAKAEEAVAYATEVEDQEALGLAQEVAAKALIEKTLAEEKIVRQEGIIFKLEQSLSWAIPKDGSMAVPVQIHGEVLVRSAKGWKPIGNAPIKKGDQIMTTDGRADLYFEDGSRIHINPHTTLTYEGKTLKGTIYRLLKGKTHTNFIPSATRGEEVLHKTLTAVIAVRGTEFDLEIDDRGLTHLYPYSGKIELTADHEEVKKAKPERWWEQGSPKEENLSKDGDRVATGSSMAKFDLLGGYAAVLAPGSELEIGKDESGGWAYFLNKGRIYVYQKAKGGAGDPPLLIVSNATAALAGAAFDVKLGEDGLADFIPLAGTVIVDAAEEGLDLEKVKPYWKE